MIETHRPTSGLPNAIVDAEAMAALALHEDAKQSRQLAREIRRDAQQGRLELARQAASKLREMAGSAIGSAVWQGVAGLASAACSAASAVTGYQAATAATGADRATLDLSSRLWDVGAKLAQLGGHIDPANLQSQFLAVEKQELEAQAEAAANRAQEQTDVESESRRLEDSAGQLLQKANDARHAANMAALRG